MQLLFPESIRAQHAQRVPTFETRYIKYFVMCVSGCSWFIPIRAYAGPRRNIVAFLKGRIIRAQSVGQQEPFGFPFPPLACGCSSAVGRTVPSVLGVAVENCTKRDRPRGICAAQSHCCVLEGLLELWWPVLSLTPSVSEFRLCLYSAGPCSAMKNVPKLFCVPSAIPWFQQPGCSAVKASPPAGSSLVKWLRFERKNVKYVIPYSALVAVRWFSASPLP